MKKYVKITSILLSFLIFIFSMYQCSMVVNAKDIYEPGTDESIFGARDWEDMTFTDKMGLVVMYVCSQVGAIADGNFVNFLSNHTGFSDYRNSIEKGDGVAVAVSNSGLTFSDDLVKFIKQTLKEYAEKNSGFWIVPTVNIHSVSASKFNSGNQYKSLKNIVDEKGIVVYGSYNQYDNRMFFPDVYSSTIPFVLICSSSSYDPDKNANSVGCPVRLYGADTWLWYSFYNYVLTPAKEYASYDEWKADAKAYTAQNTVSNFYVGQNVFSVLPGSGAARYMFVSKDGRRVQVFKSLDAYKNHDTGTRPVYFGSKFYEDSGPVSGSFDDLQDYLDGKYDDFFDQLEDLIPPGSSLTEEELEKLVDSILDKLGDIGDDISDVSGSMKETNSWLEKIFYKLEQLDATVAAALSGMGFSIDLSTIEAYLDTIVVQLGIITADLEETTEEEFSEKTDSFLDELSSAGTEIGEAVKTKFPLSIPWDVGHMLDLLGGSASSTEPEVPASYVPGNFISVASADVSAPVPLDDDSGGGSGSDKTWVFGSPTGAPVFQLPFVISESMGIEGTVYVDMSDFSVVSDLGRTFFTLLFAYGLINLTFKAVALGEDVLGS